MIDRNVAHKRRSIENKEAIMGGPGFANKLNNNNNIGGLTSNEASNNRQMINTNNGVKSALSNYGTATNPVLTNQ
jgi:hypothetical protein